MIATAAAQLSVAKQASGSTVISSRTCIVSSRVGRYHGLPRQPGRSVRFFYVAEHRKDLPFLLVHMLPQLIEQAMKPGLDDVVGF
jgi:hypothetical protein